MNALLRRAGNEAPATERYGGGRAYWIALAITLGIGLAAVRSLVAPGFYDAHDNLLNLQRAAQLGACFADGQIPCRWVPDMGAGYGYPLFHYYPSLPSAIVLALHAIGLSWFAAVKSAMAIAIVGAGVAMFALARPWLGTPGAVVAAAFYTWAPYRAIDVFVRGALAEALALALLPLAFWSAAGLLRGADPRAWALVCAVVWAALLQTHLGVCTMAGPIYAAWCLLWLVRGVGRARLLVFAGAHALAFGIAAWFVAPALVERGEIHFDALIRLYAWSRYDANFLEIDQVLLGVAPWGTGPFRAQGGMSLFVGVAHWTLGTIAVGVAAVLVRRRRVGSDTLLAAGVLLAGAWLATWATLHAAKPVWDALPWLAFLQFPWRFLGISALGFAFAAGLAVRLAPARGAIQPTLAACLIAAAVTPAWGWFRPAAMFDVDPAPLVAPDHVRRTRHGASDFLPSNVDLERFAATSATGAPPAVEWLEEDGSVRDVEQGTDWLRASVRTTRPATLRINRLSFPHWTVLVDGQPAPLVPIDDPMGRLHVALVPGLHLVEARLEDTTIRRVANATSAASAIAFAALAATLAVGSARQRLRSAPPPG